MLWVTAGMQCLQVIHHVPACSELALGAHLDAGLSTQCAHQAVQHGEAQLDVEASLLLSGDVCDAAALQLQVSAVRHLPAAGTAMATSPTGDRLAQSFQ